jgi:hypothetical protein
MKIIIFISLIAMVIFAGCTGKTSTDIQTNEGKLTVSEGTGAGPDWCKAGTASTFTSVAPGSFGSASYIIKGLTTYKGKQVCEAEAKVTGTESESIYYSQYFTQDGKYFVMVIKDSSGNILTENEVNNP